MSLKTAHIFKSSLKEIILNIQRYSPHPNKVKIVAVTKTLDNKAIKSAIDNNIYIIGENKVQETKKKIIQHTKPEKLILHMIGHLQSNKAKEAVNLYDVIQTVDSKKLAKTINSAAKKRNKKQQIFIQINISNNKEQHGTTPEKAQDLLLYILQLKNLKLSGLMAIGPNTQNKEKIKKAYTNVKRLKQQLEKTTRKPLKELSLGMSNDYIIALQSGATLIRIGRKLYGKRQ